jgi:TadE-like protein
MTNINLQKTKFFFQKIHNNDSGLALVEFAISLPFFMGLTVGGIEIANFASVTMQLNQIAIHTADNAARIGETAALAAKRITEMQVNDVFAGTLREGKRIELAGTHEYVDPVTGLKSERGNTKITLSSIEPAKDYSDINKIYRIRWQRCLGTAAQYTSTYGTVNSTPTPDGFGPVGKRVRPPKDSAIMLVELSYYYKPKIINGFLNSVTSREIRQTSSAIVRDVRDYVGPPNGDGIWPGPGPGVVASVCP